MEKLSINQKKIYCDTIFKAMALRIAKIYLRMFGVFPIPKENLPSSLRKYQMLLNFLHILFVMICLNVLYVSVLAHFMAFKAKTLIIFFQATFFISVALMRVALYVLILVKRTELSKFMNDLEQMVEMSKL